MIPIVTAILLGILSALVTILMSRETNKKLRSSHCDNDSQNVAEYTGTPLMLVVLAGIVIVSSVTGYVVANRMSFLVATIEIAACYLAVLAAAVIDIKTKTIPNVIPIALVILRFVIFIYELLFVNAAFSYLAASLVGALFCAFLLIAANKISKGGIGGGDIKLISSIGFVCGLSVAFYSMLLSLISCGIVSAVLLVSKKCSTKDQLPFGPFLYLGYLMMCLMTSY